jgi:hypothetical protein
VLRDGPLIGREVNKKALAEVLEKFK